MSLILKGREWDYFQTLAVERFPTPISGFTGSILEFPPLSFTSSNSDSYLQGLTRPSQVQSSALYFPVLFGICFCLHLFPDGYLSLVNLMELLVMISGRKYPTRSHQQQQRHHNPFKIRFVLRIKNFSLFRNFKVRFFLIIGF